MNERTPQKPPVIPPVDEQVVRPMWSVMIPAYNCSKYLAAAVESVLLQDPGEDMMQIEVVDDCSTDENVRALVERLGKGRVKYFRQEKNVGSLRNFETCLRRSKGHLVHLLHGDDLVKDGFYKETGALFNEFPEIGAAITKYTYVDEEGHETPPGVEVIADRRGVIDNWLCKIAERQKLQPPAIVVKRSVYEKLGGFFGVHYGEDWEMCIRIAANYPVAYTPKCLALYRRFQNKSITGNSIMTGQNIKDVLKVIDISQQYLPEAKRRLLKNIAKRNFAIHYAKASNRIYGYSKKAAFIQAKGALKMHLNVRTVFFASRLYLMHLLPFMRTKMRH